MTISRRLFWVALLLSACPYLNADNSNWVKSIAKTPTPTFDQAPPAVVLLDETTEEIDETGQSTERHRVAIRILENNAAKRATASVWYNEKTDKVLDADAWILRNGSFFKDKSKRDWVDASTANYLTIVEEMRAMSINLSDAAVAGDVFAYETRVRRSMLVAECTERFGSDLPCVTEQVRITVPAGFSMVPRLFGKNFPVNNSSPDGRTMMWTLSNTPYRSKEPLAPRSALTDAELFVQIVPPASATNFTPKSFSSWKEVAGWIEKVNADSCDTNPALTAKVQELTADCPDTLSKIRTLGRYVQSTRYIANNQDLNRGAGMVARKASLVFSRGFGDCKDKANLLKAMLREAGIKSHMAAALVQTGHQVHPEIPTPGQFNHAILCIEAPDGAPAQVTVNVAPFGKLLIFDPTDKHTVLGDLPESLQGTKIALDSPRVETLVDVPNIPPDQGFKVQRKAKIELAGDDGAIVETQLKLHGQRGASARYALENATTPDSLEKFFRDTLSGNLASSKILSQKTDDDLVSGRFSMTFSCGTKRFVQRLPGNLAVVKMEVFSRDNLPSFSEKERHLPIELDPDSLEDEIVLTIPAGQKVEELPAPASIDSPYGMYRLDAKIVDNTVVLTRRVTLNRVEIPVEDYAKIRQFLSAVARADRCSVILK